MKKLIIILIAISLSSCAALRAQQEEDEKLAKQEKYEFTKYVCSIYNDFKNNCDKHLKDKAAYQKCNAISYEFQHVLANYNQMYDEKFNFKICKQFVVKKLPCKGMDCSKKGKKKVNKKK